MTKGAAGPLAPSSLAPPEPRCLPGKAIPGCLSIIGSSLPSPHDALSVRGDAGGGRRCLSLKRANKTDHHMLANRLTRRRQYRFPQSEKYPWGYRKNGDKPVNNGIRFLIDISRQAAPRFTPGSLPGAAPSEVCCGEPRRRSPCTGR